MMQISKKFIVIYFFSASFLTISMNVPPPPTPEEVILNIFNVSAHASDTDKIQAVNNSYSRYQDDQLFKFNQGSQAWWLQVLFELQFSESMQAECIVELKKMPQQQLNNFGQSLVILQSVLKKSSVPRQQYESILQKIKFFNQEIQKIKSSNTRPVNPETLKRCLALTKLLHG